MVGRPGRTQASFTAGVLDPGLTDNTDIKYRAKGLKRATNIEAVPQGGFFHADGLKRIGTLPPTASRLFPFTASDGSSYDLVASHQLLTVWGADSASGSVATPFGTGQTEQLNATQLLDTAVFFHKDVRPQRVRIMAPGTWAIDDAPFQNVPNWDYGATYTNGVPAKWRLQFIEVSQGATVFVLTVSGQDTVSITAAAIGDLVAPIKAAIEDLPNVAQGITVTSATNPSRIFVEFTGAGNEGDGWAVSARVINKADAAITSTKDVAGVEPGEPLWSATRGYPRCGTFNQQRLLVGGFRSLPNAWAASIVGDYYNFDERLDETNGPFVVPMDTGGGEVIETIISQRNLLIFTSKAEYWVQDRALDKTKPPVHVQASEDGVRAGTPVVGNEGAALFVYASGHVVGEFRYADVDGNFVATSISILSAHLIDSPIVDMAVRPPSAISDGALLFCVMANGKAVTAKLLREQDVTAFVPYETDGLIKACACNGRRELSLIVERTSAAGSARYLERLDPDFLLHGAEKRVLTSPANVIGGLSVHEGRTVWCLGDGEVYGPLTVIGGSITLPDAVTAVEIGRWTPPLAELLPPTREIGPNIVMRRKARIHSAQISCEDTTSLALAANGGRTRDVALRRYGEPDETAELEAGFSGVRAVRGFTGYRDEPTLLITQLRPGRLHVRTVTVEAAL